jgi:3-hydroxyacyl-[acyl-carrier-protein] dehydratase
VGAFRRIQEVLPHRDPFLFLDEILEVSDGSVRARRTIRAEEPQFAGHYPGRPIMPGVLLCEAALQAGCYLVAAGSCVDLDPTLVPVVTRMSDVKFKRMVRPGDDLDIRVDKEETVAGVHFMKACIRSAGKVVASLRFAVTLAKQEDA